MPAEDVAQAAALLQLPHHLPKVVGAALQATAGRAEQGNAVPQTTQAAQTTGLDCPLLCWLPCNENSSTHAERGIVAAVDGLKLAVGFDGKKAVGVAGGLQCSREYTRHNVTDLNMFLLGCI
jgi:hypothetical protein